MVKRLNVASVVCYIHVYESAEQREYFLLTKRLGPHVFVRCLATVFVASKSPVALSQPYLSICKREEPVDEATIYLASSPGPTPFSSTGDLGPGKVSAAIACLH